MKIIATVVMTQDLKPGDLFSTYGPEYWSEKRFERTHQEFALPLGERVYIRTESDTPADQKNEPIYKITIEV